MSSSGSTTADTYTEVYTNPETGKKVKRIVRQVKVKRQPSASAGFAPLSSVLLIGAVAAVPLLIRKFFFKDDRSSGENNKTGAGKQGTSKGVQKQDTRASLPRNQRKKEKKGGKNHASGPASRNAKEEEKCGLCSKAVRGGVSVTAKLDDKEGVFHKACFKCQGCHKELSGKGSTKSYFEYGKKPWCQQCYGEHCAPRCAGCGLPCTGGEGINKADRKTIVAINLHWHAQCFKCSVCSAKITGSFKESLGRPVCLRCGGR